MAMARKILIGAAAVVLAAAISLFAAEKAKEKKAADKPDQEAKLAKQPKQHERLLDQLIAAYKADDKAKMGEIIKKMEQQRDKMRKFAQLNKWHQWAHRKAAMANRGQQGGWGGRGMTGRGWQQGWGMPRAGQQWGGPPCQRQFQGGGMNWGAPMGGFNRKMQPMGGCRGCPGPCGAPKGGFNRPMRNWRGDMGNIQQPAEGPDQMSGYAEQMRNEQQPDDEPAQMNDFEYGSGLAWAPDEFGPQNTWAMPPRDMQQRDVPPPEWGW